MKILLIIAIVLTVIFNANSQSLAEQTGEQVSLYNAICIINNVTPGDITMTEFRVLAKEYTSQFNNISDYSLYTNNGTNNLAILHYSVNNNNVPSNTSNDIVNISNDITNNTIEALDYTTTDLTITNTVEEVKVSSRPFIQHNEYTDTNNTVQFSFVLDTFNTIEEVSVNKVEVKTVKDDNCFCDTRNKNYDQLNNYIDDMYKLSKSSNITHSLRDKYRRCMNDAKRFVKTVHRDFEGTSVIDSSKMELYKKRELRISKREAKRTKSQKKRKASIKRAKRNRLGKGLTKGKGRDFLTKLFPFRNC